MTQFYLAVLRRSRETVRKKRPPLEGNASGFFTTTTLPHQHVALGSQFLASNRTPVVTSALRGFYAAYYSRVLPTIRDNLSVPPLRTKQSRKPLKIGQRGCPEAPVRNNYSTFFDVLLTAHLSIFILVINQLDAQNLFYNKFISYFYMFRAPCAHHQEVKILLYSLWYHHTYRCDDTRGCIIQF